jgi:hypothetical protein
MPSFQENAPTWMVQFPALPGFSEVARLRDELRDVTSQRMIREFGQAIESFARDRLMVLALDDIQRADTATLDLLAYLASRTETARLLVIAAAEEGRDWDRVQALMAPLYGRGLCEHVRLDVFSEEDVKRYLDARYPCSDAQRSTASDLEWCSALSLFSDRVHGSTEMDPENGQRLARQHSRRSA